VLGGASRSLALVVHQLVRAGCRVTVLAPAGPARAGWEKAGAEVLAWSPPACSWMGRQLYSIFTAEPGLDRLAYNVVEMARVPFVTPGAVRRLEEVVRDRAIGTVYANTVPLFPLAGALAKLRARGVRVIWQL